MAQPLTLFDLFGESTIARVVARWPQSVQPVTGVIANWPPPAFSAWLAALNNAVTVQDVRTGADGDRVAVEAKLGMTAVSVYPNGFPFVIGSMPDVEFRLQYATTAENLIQLFASISDRGAEIVVERVPVEIRLPRGLVGPHPSPDTGTALPYNAAEYTVGEFRPGQLDDLQIVYRRDDPTSVFVHVRIHATEDGEFDIRTAVPVSFGPCTFSGIPCLALHDFQLIPSPSLAPSNVHWLRHSVRPWAPALVGPVDGCFSIRSVQVDPSTDPLNELARWLHDRNAPTAEEGATAPTSVTPQVPGSKSDAHAEFVLDDLVIPFFSPWAIPIPRHITIGLRRRILDADDPKQVFSFDEAPVQIKFQEDPPIGLIVNSLFYTSLPGAVGLTFDAVIVAGTRDEEGKNHPFGFGIALEENYTPALSYRRDIDPATNLPVLAATPPLSWLDKALHYEIATITIDIVSIKLGFSFGRFLGDRAGVGGSIEALVDIFVGMPPSGFPGVIELKSLNGEQVKFILEGIGYRFGALQLDGVRLPDGVMIVIASRFSIIVQELGLRAEQGATYLSFSGGLALSLSGFEGGFTVRRLRFRIAGNAGAPPFKVDGFFIFLRVGDTFSLEVGGYYLEERTPVLQRKEFGLTGTIKIDAGKKFELSIDFIVGHVSTTAPVVESFMYVMFQIVLRVTIQVQCVEILSFRLLFARNMKPKLRPVDQNARDLRYYRWYRENDPLTVPGERRLASWESRNDAIAVGTGFGISFSGAGSVFDLTAFALFLWGPDEKGLLIVVELHLLGKPKPIGYLAIELDFQNGRWSGILGVAVKLDIFFDDPPDWLANIGQLTGTVFFGNDPNTFAIGRLNDQRTWLGLRFAWTTWAIFHVNFLICLELVENGPHGFGTVARIEGKIEAGVVNVDFSFGAGIMISAFTTASHDFAFVVWIEAAFRIVAFGFLHFGVSANASGRVVGANPSRGEVRFEVQLETPWFIPDITWTWDITFGSLAPADLATSTSPLTSAGALEGAQQKNSPLHVERFDPNFADGRASRTFSVNEMRAAPRPEATRLANFAADTAIHPIATDATIAVDWAVPVNDKLRLTPGLAAGRGDQRSGDLTLSYDLVGIAVRRRARFGSDQSWHGVDQRVELSADFSDPAGVKLGGSFAPQAIAATWDLGVRVEGAPTPKRLLINSVAPFQFATSDLETDEELVRRNPEWPCCPGVPQQRPPIHTVTFTDEPAGIDLDTPRFFSESSSRFDFLCPAIAAEHQLGGLPTGVAVACATLTFPGALARATFDEDVAYCAIRLAWATGGGAISIIARSATGDVVGTRTVPLGPGGAFQTVAIGGTAPIRRIELCHVATLSGGRLTQAAFEPQSSRAYIEIEGALYIALDDYLDFAAAIKCDDGSHAFHTAYEGKGKLFFLPNHEYEIALTTRVTVAHPSTTATSADVVEHLYFRTKGLPGLNAVQRIGEEIEPYVRSTYDGGRGTLYREEPIVLAFAEGFSIAVPLAVRPTGSAAEHTTLMRMQLVARPDTAPTVGTPFTSTSADWIIENRVTATVVDALPTWSVLKSDGRTTGSGMISTDSYQARLAQITQRPNATCPLADPRRVIGTVLIAPPQGTPDPDDATKALWPAALAHTAAVFVEGAAFVERIVFDPADLTALDFSVDAGSGDASMWSVSSGALEVATGTSRRYAIFGDPSWDHLRLSVRIQLDTTSGTSAGVALALPAAAAPSDGLFAFIEVGAAGRRLVLAQRTGGAALVEMSQVALPAPADPAEPVTLQVWGFDDRVRVMVGDQVVEAERGALREGRVALVALGPARFTDLRLQGLELYAFPFTTSRYRSFHDHVQSWGGELASISPNVLGPGTTTSTVGALWTATQGDVTAAMHVEAPSSARDDVFARWIRELGLPVRDEVTELELSRFVVGGQTACLLVESPEAIDFTAEVTATLERQMTTTSPSLVAASGLTLGLVARQPTQRPLPRSARLDTFSQLLQMIEAQASRSRGAPDQVKPTIAGLARHLRGVDVAFDVASLPGDAAGSDVLVLERVGVAGGALEARIYRGTMTASLVGATATVRAGEAESVVLTGADRSWALSGVLAGMTVGSVVAVLTTAGGTFVTPSTSMAYVDVPVRVIQDGSGRRCILVPVTGGAAVAMPAGTYRLSLQLERERWSTTDAPDDWNRYADSAQVTLVL